MKIRMENLYLDIGTKGYKLCIFTFPEAASGSSYGHLFYVTNNCSVPAISIRVFLECFKKVRLAFHGITEIFHKCTFTNVRKSCCTSR